MKHHKFTTEEREELLKNPNISKVLNSNVEYMINSLAGQNCYDITINSNVEVGRPSSNTYILNCFATPHVKINKDPSVCDIFD